LTIIYGNCKKWRKGKTEKMASTGRCPPFCGIQGMPVA